MAVKILTSQTEQQPPSLPELSRRVAVLGGSNTEKSQLLLGLALRQTRQQRSVLCLDGRQQKQTEVQFRLLLRGQHSYIALPPGGAISQDVEQRVLSHMSQGLTSQPPLLLLDAVLETTAWEQTLAFLLKAGVCVIELLADASHLTFGRYDTVLLLRMDEKAAELSSRAVGRRVDVSAIRELPSGEGILLHLSQAWRVKLPAVRMD